MQGNGFFLGQSQINLLAIPKVCFEINNRRSICIYQFLMTKFVLKHVLTVQ